VRNADVVVNAAAWTAVDAAEDAPGEAGAVNTTGAAHLARAAAVSGAWLVQVSTDYVFNGRASVPYPEDAPRSPLGVYGGSKARGEEQVHAILPRRSWIVRTAWLYGDGPCFPRKMLELARRCETIDVVADQIGQPTWSRDAARRIVEVVDAGAPAGIYHATNAGQASWFDFARAVFGDAGLDPNRILPTTSARFTRPAPRPAWSVLGHAAWSRIGLAPMRPWRDALSEAIHVGALS
jgi:dTDP-4-dehydrorhamnose reductase